MYTLVFHNHVEILLNHFLWDLITFLTFIQLVNVLSIWMDKFCIQTILAPAFKTVNIMCCPKIICFLFLSKRFLNSKLLSCIITTLYYTTSLMLNGLHSVKKYIQLHLSKSIAKQSIILYLTRLKYLAFHLSNSN